MDFDKVFQHHFSTEDKINYIKEGRWDCINMVNGRFYKRTSDMDPSLFREVTVPFGPLVATKLYFECDFKGHIGIKTLDGIKPLEGSLPLDPYSSYVILDL